MSQSYSWVIMLPRHVLPDIHDFSIITTKTSLFCYYRNPWKIKDHSITWSAFLEAFGVFLSSSIALSQHYYTMSWSRFVMMFRLLSRHRSPSRDWTSWWDPSHHLLLGHPLALLALHLQGRHVLSFLQLEVSDFCIGFSLIYNSLKLFVVKLPNFAISALRFWQMC